MLPANVGSHLALKVGDCWQKLLLPFFLWTTKRREYSPNMDLSNQVHQHHRSRAASILGSKSNFACPICLAPRCELWNLTGKYPLRTKQETMAVLHEAKVAPTRKQKHDILLRQSIRYMMVGQNVHLDSGVLKSWEQNTLLKYFSNYIDVYQTFPAEPLHQIEQGIYGKHMWPWIKASYLTAHELAILDEK